jgi:hypothetical protein
MSIYLTAVYFATWHKRLASTIFICIFCFPTCKKSIAFVSKYFFRVFLLANFRFILCSFLLRTHICHSKCFSRLDLKNFKSKPLLVKLFITENLRHALTSLSTFSCNFLLVCVSSLPEPN